MEPTTFSPEVRYIVTDDGMRTEVVLKLADYETLKSGISSDPDLLVGLTEDELRALAGGMLEASRQDRLAEMLKRNREGDLAEDEKAELNRLIAGVDAMNILKARAMYTLRQMESNQMESKGSD